MVPFHAHAKVPSIYAYLPSRSEPGIPPFQSICQPIPLALDLVTSTLGKTLSGSSTSPLHFLARNPQLLIRTPAFLSARGTKRPQGLISGQYMDSASESEPPTKRARFSDLKETDLYEKTWEELDTLQAKSSDEGDVVMLEALRKFYKDKISAIDTAIAAGPRHNLQDTLQSNDSEPLWSSSTEPRNDCTTPHKDIGFGCFRRYNDILRKRFKISKLRCGQREAIERILAGEDTFVLMPTGSGKSLCFQLPALYLHEYSNSITIVISPLRSLIEDQVAALVTKGIHAFGLSADTPEAEVRKWLVHAPTKPALVYCTPEKIKTGQILRKILMDLHHPSGQIGLIAIDEVHCIRTWGVDFRQQFSELRTLRNDFRGVPIITLTATAARADITAITGILQLKDTCIIRLPLNRPNLEYRVTRKGSPSETDSAIIDIIM